jgi:predicted DNA-binding transcriptional regulator AlpA
MMRWAGSMEFEMKVVNVGMLSPSQWEAGSTETVGCSLKAADVCDRLNIGRTLLRELYRPEAKNFDPHFPKPFSLTPKGPKYFDGAEVDRWFGHRKRISREEALSSS